MGTQVLAWLSYPVTLVVLVALTAVVAVAASVLEQRTPRRTLPHGVLFATFAMAVDAMFGGLVGAATERFPGRGRPPRGRRPGAPSEPGHGSSPPSALAAEATGAPVARGAAVGPSPELVLRRGGPDGPWVRLGPLGSDRDLAGVLFAAYVASGGDEASRVTGWVSPCGNPPSIGDLASGDRMRGRVTRILELLACRDGGENWIMLDPRTDISLALDRRAPSDPVLRGLVEWWRLSTRDSHQVAPDDVAPLADAIEWVLPALKVHPFAELVESVLGFSRDAVREHQALSVGAASGGRLQPAGVPHRVPLRAN